MLLTSGNSYGALVGVPATDCTSSSRLRVRAFRPDLSELVNKITGVGYCSGSQMPLTGPLLSASQIALIESWICRGALNN